LRSDLTAFRLCALIFDAIFGCAVRWGLVEGRGRAESCSGCGCVCVFTTAGHVPGSKFVKQLYTPKMMMTINLEKTLIAKEEKSYENSLSEAKDTVSRWYDDTASWPGQIPV
jgi:hypothetical protein